MLFFWMVAIVAVQLARTDRSNEVTPEVEFPEDFVIPNSENCTCVPYYQCSEESGSMLTDGTDLFDVR